MAPRSAFYAVGRGRIPGVYRTWDECKKQVDGYNGARYKKFPSEAEARDFIAQNSGAGPSKSVVPSTSSLRVPIVDTRKRKLTTGVDHSAEGCVTKKSKGFEDYTVVYTDGACSNNGKRGAKAGWGVYWGDEHVDNDCGAVWGEATNNRGELIAALKAMQKARERGINKLLIRTDSQLLINSLDQWLPGWKRKGWKKSDGQPVKNVDLLKELDGLRSTFSVKFEYVVAHSGIDGNEKADRLAVQGAAKFV